MGYKGLQGVTHGLQEVRRGYKGDRRLKGVTGVLKGLQGVTTGYKGYREI